MQRRYFKGPNSGGGAKGSTGSPAYFLPPELYNHFKPKQGIPFWKQTQPPAPEAYKVRLGGLAQTLKTKFQSPANGAIGQLKDRKDDDPEKRIVKYRWELREMKQARKRAEFALKVQERLLTWDPNAPNEAKTMNGYLTLFVGRLNPKTTEQDLIELMRQNGGEVTKCRIVKDLRHPKRSYAFVEFADENAQKKAYRAADGMMLNGSHIVCDVERGRTVSQWAPRRLGGGLGGPPRTKGSTLKRGRGPPEPPPMVDNRKRFRTDGYRQ